MPVLVACHAGTLQKALTNSRLDVPPFLCVLLHAESAGSKVLQQMWTGVLGSVQSFRVHLLVELRTGNEMFL